VVVRITFVFLSPLAFILAGSENSKMATQVKHVPKDAQVIMSIMKDMGIQEYEPHVINQLLEFTYRKYV
jgi:hypothetical protein